MNQESTDENNTKNAKRRNNFDIRVIIEYALNKKKSDQFKTKFNFPMVFYKSKTVEIKQSLFNEIKNDKLMGFLNRVVKSKTYLHDEGRVIIESFIRKNHTIDHPLRKKVN